MNPSEGQSLLEAPPNIQCNGSEARPSTANVTRFNRQLVTEIKLFGSRCKLHLHSVGFSHKAVQRVTHHTK